MNCVIARRYIPLVLVIICFFIGAVDGSVMLVGRNPVISFDDAEAAFGPDIIQAHGMLHMARPLHACTPLKNHLGNTSRSNFALIIRGGCSFHKKINRAQAAGFDLAVVYNNKYSDWLLSMGGDGRGIKIAAIFISRESGETLAEYAGQTGADVRIQPNVDAERDSSARIEAVRVVISDLLLFVAVVCPFVIMYLRCARRPTEPAMLVQLPVRMTRKSVKVMPCVMYEYDPNGTDITTCVICLEDFTTGEQLRVLPCNHKFHVKCIDSWLIKRRSLCPICRHDARIKRHNPPASVSIPVLHPPLPPSEVLPVNACFARFIPCFNYFNFTNGSSSSRTL